MVSIVTVSALKPMKGEILISIPHGELKHGTVQRTSDLFGFSVTLTVPIEDIEPPTSRSKLHCARSPKTGQGESLLVAATYNLPAFQHIATKSWSKEWRERRNRC